MRNFELCNPTRLIFGQGTIGRIGEEIRRAGHRKILLLAGGGSIKANGVYEQVTQSLRQNNLEWVEAWGVRPNPVLSTVREMIRLAKSNRVEAILAVGGGSVIDSAKSVAAGVFVEDIWAFYENHMKVEQALPLYTVLTISATGSEMNHFAVLSNDLQQKKYNISGPALYPRASIIDPTVQMGLPWHQTANGAIDAMSHIMESYFLADEAETTLAVDEGLLRTVVKVTDELQRNPHGYEARASLAWAATLALNGISGAGSGGGDWASHGIEHGLSAVNPHIAHGAGLGVVFPAWIAYCQQENPALFARWAQQMWGADDVAAGIASMKAKLRQWKSPTTLAELGITEAVQIDAVVEHAMVSGMTGSLRQLNEADIRAILLLAAQ